MSNVGSPSVPLQLLLDPAPPVTARRARRGSATRGCERGVGTQDPARCLPGVDALSIAPHLAIRSPQELIGFGKLRSMSVTRAAAVRASSYRRAE